MSAWVDQEEAIPCANNCGTSTAKPEETRNWIHVEQVETGQKYWLCSWRCLGLFSSSQFVLERKH